MTPLPPNPLPAMLDPCFSNKPSPYSQSGLADVCGSRIAPDSIGWYRRRNLLRLPNSPIKTCVHPEMEFWLGDVGSYDPRAQMRQPAIQDWPMTAIVPQIVVWGEKMPFPVPPMTYVIAYRYLHSNPQTLPERGWVMRLRERFPEGSQLILFFFHSHKLKLGLWGLTDFWYHPFLDQFDAVIMPDFSAFSDDPVPQYLLGERMQQIFASEGTAAGKVTIPSIAWSSEKSLRRQLELWTSQYPRVNTIHLDCDGSNVDKTLWAWRWLYAMEKYCAGRDHIRWLISGMSSGWVIRELNRIFPKKNYCLMPSVSSFIGATKGSTDPEWQGQKFRSKMLQLQALRNGDEVAELGERPDYWPKYSDIKAYQETKELEEKEQG